MATTVVLTDVLREPAASTAVLVRFSDGTEYQFPDFARLAAWAQQADRDVTLTRQMCVAYALARSEDLANLSPVQAKAFTFDLAQNNPVGVSANKVV